MTKRVRIALAVAALLAFAALLGVCVHRRSAQEPTAEPIVLHLDEGTLRYTFHVPTGEEGLFDLASDPDMLHNLRDVREADVTRLRDALTRRVGVARLAELRNAHRETMDRLHALGYY